MHELDRVHTIVTNMRKSRISRLFIWFFCVILLVSGAGRAFAESSGETRVESAWEETVIEPSPNYSFFALNGEVPYAYAIFLEKDGIVCLRDIEDEIHRQMGTPDMEPFYRYEAFCLNALAGRPNIWIESEIDLRRKIDDEIMQETGVQLLPISNALSWSGVYLLLSVSRDEYKINRMAEAEMMLSKGEMGN